MHYERLSRGALVGCAGGGGSSGTSTFGGNGGSTGTTYSSGSASAPNSTCVSTTATSVDVLASATTVSGGGDTVTVTAVVKGPGNVGLAGAAVTFSAHSGNVTGGSTVTDASGNAKATLTAGADRSDRTSVYTYSSAAGGYCACNNEDANYNGVLDPGEDFNGDGKLEPGNVISVTTDLSPAPAATGTARTDSAGRATITLLYAESYVPWVEVRLVAQAIVAGTESSTDTVFIPPGVSSDFTNATNPPPGVVSPFGTRACNLPN